MEHPYIVVGGGFAGLIMAKTLKQKGIDFIGLERSDRLGGRATIGHHRFHAEPSLEHLKRYVAALEWSAVEDLPKERKKGAWKEITADYSEEESFYLNSPFFVPKQTLEEILDELAEEVLPQFKLNKTVVQILPSSKKIVCQEGDELAYSKVIWCSPLSLLAKLWMGEKKSLAKLFKKSETDNGGINLDLELELTPDKLGEIFPSNNTTSFSFRFKDKVLRTLGTPRVHDNVSHLHWILFLPKTIVEDREEVAKCVRTLKRELLKEFPDLKDSIKSERIVYLPNISGDPQVKVKSVEILPDLYYVGSQVQAEETEDGLHNLDRILKNCRQLETAL